MADSKPTVSVIVLNVSCLNALARNRLEVPWNALDLHLEESDEAIGGHVTTYCFICVFSRKEKLPIPSDMLTVYIVLLIPPVDLSTF